MHFASPAVGRHSLPRLQIFATQPRSRESNFIMQQNPARYAAARRRDAARRCRGWLLIMLGGSTVEVNLLEEVPFLPRSPGRLGNKLGRNPLDSWRTKLQSQKQFYVIARILTLQICLRKVACPPFGSLPTGEDGWTAGGEKRAADSG